jgi:transposase
MSKTRKHYTTAEKVAILRCHLVEHVPISNVCDRHGISVSMFYNWQNQFFQNGAAAFERDRSAPSKDQDRVITALREKLQRKNEVIAELMEEHVKLKKERKASANPLCKSRSAGGP